MMAYPTLLKCPFANMPEKPTTKKCPKYTSTKSELPLERFQNYVTEAANSMDEHLKELGGSVSEVIVLNATHEQTQQMAFDTDLFNWFLSNTNNAADDVLASAT